MNLEELENKLAENSKQIIENANRIEKNLTQIHKNTGALDILKEFKNDSKMFFIMWIMTFTAFMCLLTYTIFLLNDTQSVETTQEVTQENTDGNNNYIGRDGEIYGEAKS